MTDFLQDLGLRLLDYLRSFPIVYQSGYFSDQWDKYFSVAGFLVGLFFLILLYCANKDKELRPFKGMFQVLMMVAVINGVGALWKLLAAKYNMISPVELFPFLIDDSLWSTPFYDFVDSVLFQAENIFSGFLLTMALHTTYRRRTWAGASFGLVVRLALVFMNYPMLAMDSVDSSILSGVYYILIAQAVAIYFFSAIITKRRNFSTSWLWYNFYLFVPYLLLACVFLIGSAIEGSLAEAWEIIAELRLLLPRLLPTMAISGGILALAILFDLSLKSTKKRP